MKKRSFLTAVLLGFTAVLLLPSAFIRADDTPKDDTPKLDYYDPEVFSYEYSSREKKN